LEEVENVMELNQFSSPLLMRHRVLSYPNIKNANSRVHVKKNSFPQSAKDNALDNESFTTYDDEDEVIENGHDEFIYIQGCMHPKIQ
jgi:hypothetical protein